MKKEKFWLFSLIGHVADVSIAGTLSKGIFGKLLGDKGVISKELSKSVLKQGLERLTTIRSESEVHEIDGQNSS
ncbi:hypothetical protein DB44_AT00170 [Candidatus Protochlamydia amoebophila]|uniref:Transposase DDE domain-containing protein n=1 Tax=Candidatus Protochlamydia amoebophila TaxID=362787 RepID=A0A0C1HGV9_9BACT|nr:hypothetical protein DB44_AT00170 [Candidatus Protochlamydia amoebophila]